VKKSLILICLALAAPLAMAQQTPVPAPAPAPAAKPAADADPVIMTAGPLSIHKSEFETAVKSLPQEYQTFAMGPGKKQFAEDYLRMKLLASQGMQAGLDKTPEIQTQLDLMRENLVATEQLKQIEKGIKISDDDLKKAYDAAKKDYEQVQARHILVAFKGSPALPPGKPELTEEQAKAKAESLRKQIVDGTAKFEDVAKKESDDSGSGARGGDLGSFSKGQMVPEFDQAAFAAKDNEISPVVRTQFGYHIIQVMGHSSVPFEQVKATLEKKQREEQLHQRLDAIKDSAKPTFNEAYFPSPPPPPPAKKQ
jgi:peptidyl-prolyl cis-trans isomerase C